MIAPDSKDWTWVLDRACPDCGFDASACRPESVAGLVEENAGVWERLLAARVIRAGRPDDASWSSLEYACHVRDVYRRYEERIALMLADDDPLFPNWDQDATAVEERYDAQDPARVVHELRGAATALVARLDGLADTDSLRRGRRSDGASFTIGTLSRYMVHDPIHHVWDVTQRR